MANSFKKHQGKVRSFNWYWYVINCRKGIREGICNVIYWLAKVNNKCMKDYDKNKESSYLSYWDLNNLYGWAMSGKLPINNFQWIKETTQFNKDFIKKL